MKIPRDWHRETIPTSSSWSSKIRVEQWVRENISPKDYFSNLGIVLLLDPEKVLAYGQGWVIVTDTK
jgi:hypothetical protein